MDANGNLTDISEFAGGRRIRLISYMNPDIAVGGFEALPDPAWLGVHHVSAGDPERSIFVVNAYGAGFFTLAWAKEPGNYVTWWGNPYTTALMLGLAYDNDPNPVGVDGKPIELPPFTVDFVDGPWLALNEQYRGAVFDSSESGQDERNPILLFPWNGGDNQKWRAATRGPGLG